ncbi:MAG: hypothetical protein ACT4OD_04430 [Candidatus Nitrosotenuis sp.]
MKAKIIGTITTSAVVVSLIMIIIFIGPVDVSTPKAEDQFKNWNRSGPFAINKVEYRIGDSVFMAVEGLIPDDVGSAIFVLPNGTTKYISIPFDGREKSGFNQYFKPAISKGRSICSINDLIGEWTVVFKGTEYTPLKFRIINETLPSEAGNFEKVC